MKFILLTLLLSFGVSAQEMTLNEAFSVFDQYSDVLTKVEVGHSVIFDSYETRGACVIHDQSTMTVLELTSEYALVLNEVITTDKCAGTSSTKKFLSKDSMINLEALKAQMTKTYVGWKMNRKENIMTFEGTVGTDKFTMQYDLRSSLFCNWVHYHHSYPGVEDHNIRNSTKNRLIPMSEVKGLPLCERDPLKLDILKCQDAI